MYYQSFANHSLCLTTSFPQLLLVIGVNLWKSILNVFQNALINIPTCFILFHKGVNKGELISGINVNKDIVICGINVSQCCYLSEHYITISLLMSTPPLTFCGGKDKT